MNIIRLALVGTLVCAALYDRALGADFKTSQLKDGRLIASLSGEIVEGDAEQLKSAIKAANDAGKLLGSIRLNSIGGNLLEGVKLAQVVRVAKMTTNVGASSICASACFLVFAAGDKKFANYTAQIGVHGAADKNGAETIQANAATVSMAKVARELGVPDSIIGRMVVTPPSDMVWLSPPDIQSMGTTMVGKPSQLQPEVSRTDHPQQLPPGDPVSLAPNSTATVSQNDHLTWNDFVDAVAKISAKQNSGTPRYFRGCQPDLKVCITGVTFRNKDNKEMAAKVVQDMNEKILTREVCELNVTSDIRFCTDWDRGTTHRDMKDIQGEWHQIAND